MREQFAFKKLFLGALLGVLLLSVSGMVSAGEMDTDSDILEEISEANTSTGGEMLTKDNISNEDDTTVMVSSTDATSSSPQTGGQTGYVDFPMILLIGCLGFTVTAICAKKKEAF